MHTFGWIIVGLVVTEVLASLIMRNKTKDGDDACALWVLLFFLWTGITLLLT